MIVTISLKTSSLVQISIDLVSPDIYHIRQVPQTYFRSSNSYVCNKRLDHIISGLNERLQDQCETCLGFG